MSIDFECPKCGIKMSGRMGQLEVNPRSLELIRDRTKQYKILQSEIKEVCKVSARNKVKVPTTYRVLLAIGLKHKDEFDLSLIGEKEVKE